MTKFLLMFLQSKGEYSFRLSVFFVGSYFSYNKVSMNIFSFCKVYIEGAYQTVQISRLILALDCIVSKPVFAASK